MSEKRELTQAEIARLKHIVKDMQGISHELKVLFDEQRYKSSEANQLYNLSLKLMDRYGMMPGQRYAESEAGNE